MSPSSQLSAKAVTTVGLAAVIAAVLLMPTLFAQANAGKNSQNLGDAPEGKVTICHRTTDPADPYNQLNLGPAAVDGNGNGDHYGAHAGPVWRPSATAGDSWGDIIPPIAGEHDGLNWNRQDKAIWRNGCLPADPPTKPVTPTLPPAPTPSPTPSPPAPTTSPTPTPPTTPTATASPSNSPTPSPTETTPAKPPKVPIVVLPAKPDIKPGEWVDLIDDIRAAGDLKIKVNCRVNGVKMNDVCATVVKKRQIRVKADCSDNVSLTVRLKATRDDFRINRWRGRWQVDGGDFVACTRQGNG